MKNFKFGFIVLCGLLFTFGSCKKKDDTPAANNSFVVGNSNYIANLSFAHEYNPDYDTEIYFANKTLSAGATGINVAWFDFYLQTLPSSGTFTYKAKSASDFNAASNFSDLVVGYNTTYTADGNLSGGAFYSSSTYDATGSAITISKSGSTYTFVYDLKFTKDGKITEVKGQYNGAVTK